jgi:hypothetical protein
VHNEAHFANSFFIISQLDFNEIENSFSKKLEVEQLKLEFNMPRSGVVRELSGTR